MSWHSSNVPSIARLWMFGSSSAYICACWNALIRPCGDSMNTAMFRLPRIAYSAELPVSPDVAPRMLSRRSLLAQRVFEKMAEELQRDVLERERRAVRKAKQMKPRLERRERRDVLAAEHLGRVCALDDRAQFVPGNIVDEAREDRERERRIRESAHARDLARRKPRIRARHGKAAIGCEPFEQDRAKRLWRVVPRAARADVLHCRRRRGPEASPMRIISSDPRAGCARPSRAPWATPRCVRWHP